MRISRDLRMAGLQPGHWEGALAEPAGLAAAALPLLRIAPAS